MLTGQTETFTYNGLNELTQETLFNGTTISYTYDALGNILTQTVTPSGGQPTTTTYGYDTEHNQLTSINGVAVTSDANGNLTNDGTNRYTWTAANQLTSVGTASGTLSITYDGLGRPNQFTTPSGQVEQIHYVGTSNNPAYLTDGSNNVVARWTYGPNGLPALMAVNVSGSWDTYEYVYNGLDDVIGLIDLTSGSSTYGHMVVQYQYDAYGNTLSTTDTSGVTVLGQGLAAFNPFQYRGYYKMPGVNLYDLGARVYNPAWGRFISRDPSGYTAGDITDYNGYSYAADNPMTFIDPTGTSEMALDATLFTLDGLTSWIPGVDVIMVGATVVVAGAYAGYQIYTANWGQSKTNNGKPKGKVVRGGSKSSRDQWFGHNDKNFRRWVHREMEGKKQENLSKEEIEDLYEEWENAGSPKS